MTTPSLRIPVGTDLEAFKKGMQETTSLARTATRKVAQQFLEMNNEIAASAGAAGARWALGWAGKAALVVGSIKLIGDAISATRDQLKEMVDLSNKAQDLGISPSFLQTFRAESRKLQVEVGELDSALSHAFQATKDRAPIDLGEWDFSKEKITEVEKALRVYNATVASGNLEGLVLFRDADTQEKKIQAVLKAMIQLEQIGERAAILDLGDKMFGTAFGDRIRQGRASAEGLLATIQKASGDASGIFPDALVRRAKEMDDQLKLAHQRLSTELKPSWDGLADAMLTIKGYWADTIVLISQAVSLVNQAVALINKIKVPGYSTATLDDKIAEYKQLTDAIEGKGGGLYGSVKLPALNIPGIGKVFDSTDEKMLAHRDRLQREIAEMSKGEQNGPFLPNQSRGAGPKPTLKPTGSDTDKFETSADTIEKRTAALQAEAAAVDLGTAARERAKVTAQLETVAKQANAAAGLGENVVTRQQRDRINEVASAYSSAAQQIEKARIASIIKFGQQTGLLSPEDAAIAQQLKGIYPDVATALGSIEAQAMRTNEAMRGISSTMSSTMTSGLADMLDGTKSVADGFRDMSKTIIRALEEAVIKMLVVQPIMRGLQGAFGFSDGGLATKPQGFDTGGIVRGPGTSTSDSIPAYLSNGEFVVNAKATARHLPLLRAMNDHAIPRFADGGGPVGGDTSAAPMIGGQTVIAPTIAVTVQGSAGGSPQDHARMGENIAKAAGDSIKRMIATELRNQSRPGGTLSRR